MLETWGPSAAVFLPLVGSVVILAIPKSRERTVMAASALFSGVPLVIAIAILAAFRYADSGTMQLEVDVSWIPTINARYHVGLDGVSLPLFALTFLTTFLCVVYSFAFLPEPRNAKVFMALLLVLETGMAGTFFALDLVLFFIFWELVLVPMYFLIAVWGGPRREYAAIKFFLYTLFGSIFMLVGFIALYVRSDPHTFDILSLAEHGRTIGWSALFGNLVFAGIFLGFAIKVPMWPFHTWLPDAHTEAPTVGSVVLAAILLKMGTYGFVRISLPVLPDTSVSWAPYIGLLGAVAIVYAALACLAQTDVKRLIAFSSVGHMGFVMLGISTLTDRGINGAILAMVVHGLITGMLFFIAGSVHERFHTREIGRLGGMMLMTPFLGATLAYSAIASLGLPGLAGFWGEFFSLLGAYNPAPALGTLVTFFRVLLVLGVIGTLLTAAYFLWMLQRVNLGRPKEEWEGQSFKDVTRVEWLAWAPLLVLILVVGVYPRLLLDVTSGAVEVISRIFG